MGRRHGAKRRAEVRSQRSSRHHRPAFRSLGFEPLEGRRLLTSIVVTTASDAVSHSGESLRDAIATANADAHNGTSDTITFAANLNGQTITLSQATLELGAGGAGTGVISIVGAGQVTISGASAYTVFTVDAGVTASLQGLAITLGYSSADGGGIINAGTLTVSNSTLNGNIALEGGGIDNTGTLTVSNTTIVGNTANGEGLNGGAGIYNNGGTATITNTFFSANLATGYYYSNAGGGGGIRNLGTMTVGGSEFDGNTATGGVGAGGAVNNSGTMTISDSSFSNSSSFQSGGAVMNSGTLSVNNSTFAQNSANNYGGAIWSNNVLTVSNSTIVGNYSGTSGGGIVSYGSVTLLNTIVAGNSDYNGIPDIDGTIQSSSAYNLIGNGNGVTGISNNDANHNQVGTSASPIAPGLSSLYYYGGGTQTMALYANSPARDAGGAITTVSSTITPTATTIPVTLGSAIAVTPGSYVIRIDSEQILVTNVSGNTLTVTRGYNGTTATLHSAGAWVYWASDQIGQPRSDSAPDIGAFEYQTLDSSVNPLPTIVYSSTVLVTWSGHPATNGPAIANYTVYVSDNGGAYTIWQNHTTATAANFVGQFGHTYRFYSVATDLRGNVQVTPSGAQATTTLLLLPPAINSLSGTVNYTVGSGATLIASGATVTAGSNTLGDAVLKVALTGSSGSADVLTVVAGNGVTLSNKTILYNGTAVGVFQAGAGASPLIVQFYISATTAAVQAVLDDVAFYNTNAQASIFDRTASFTLTDSSNTSSNTATKTIHFVAAPPVLGGISGTVNYAPGAGATVVASGATITAGTNGLAAAKLSVGLGSNAGSADRVTVVAGNGITINGTQLLYNGVVIATFAAGSGSTPLVIQFNASATAAAVQAVLDDVAYYNTNPSMSVYDRTISFTLTDSKGVASNVASKTIHVT
ncbi:MAG TPA: choice-of-anchor Q domain-containing protein [Pirellulales bacterium]|jgi:hypothetical protein|nr:choice-of-anchor Q domain-containing protein [Pirellulales bacterium]